MLVRCEVVLFVQSKQLFLCCVVLCCVGAAGEEWETETETETDMVIQFQVEAAPPRPLLLPFPTLPQFRPNSFFPIKANNFGFNNNVTFAQVKSRVTLCSASASASAQTQQLWQQVRDRSVSVVLLAGGKGKRMGADMPKQYLPLLGQPIALYSFYTFSHMVEVKEIIVVCDPSYKDVFEDAKGNDQVELKFALPGKERQDSVYSGLQAIDSNSKLVCIHDSARPLVLSGDVKKVLKDGLLNGAAVLGVPVKATIKEANSESFVVRTLDRKTLWEMQTPQVIVPELLRKGFELVNREGLEVTDDVSIIEHLKHPVYVTEGSYTNIKCYCCHTARTYLAPTKPVALKLHLGIKELMPENLGFSTTISWFGSR